MSTARRAFVIAIVAGLAATAGALLAPALAQVAGFRDVPSGHVHGAGIEWVARSGVTSGCEPGQYCPHDPVTRAQMGTFMQRLAGQAPDVPPSVDAATVGGLTPEQLQVPGPEGPRGPEGPQGPPGETAAVELDQERALAGGITPGDEPGFPVSITEPGSYYLASNLVVGDAATSAIVIETPGVALNLNGFAVLGPVTCTGVPVTSCSPDSGATGVVGESRSKIHGGTIQGFGDSGVSARGDSLLLDLIVAHNAGTGVTLVSDGASLRRSAVVQNGGNGVVAGTVSGFAEVSESTVRANGQRGVSMCGGLVLNSKLHRNGGEGLFSGCVAADAGYALNAIRDNHDRTGGNQVTGGRAIGCNLIQGGAVCP